MKAKTIVNHVTADGKDLRWCMMCGVHLDKEGNIDLDFYTARQYIKLTAVPIEQRCKHEADRPDGKEELLKKVDNVFASLYPGQRELIKDIIRRLP